MNRSQWSKLYLETIRDEFGPGVHGDKSMAVSLKFAELQYQLCFIVIVGFCCCCCVVWCDGCFEKCLDNYSWLA